MIVQPQTTPADMLHTAGAAPVRPGPDAAVAAKSQVTPPSAVQVQQAVEKVQQVVALAAQNLQFTVDEDSGRTIIKVVDTLTKEVVRQIPTDEVLSMSRALGRMQGLLLTGKA